MKNERIFVLLQIFHSIFGFNSCLKRTTYQISYQFLIIAFTICSIFYLPTENFAENLPGRIEILSIGITINFYVLNFISIGKIVLDISYFPMKLKTYKNWFKIIQLLKVDKNSIDKLFLILFIVHLITIPILASEAVFSKFVWNGDDFELVHSFFHGIGAALLYLHVTIDTYLAIVFLQSNFYISNQNSRVSPEKLETRIHDAGVSVDPRKREILE
jgi:hypothetical protein